MYVIVDSASSNIYLVYNNNHFFEYTFFKLIKEQIASKLVEQHNNIII